MPIIKISMNAGYQKNSLELLLHSGRQQLFIKKSNSFWNKYLTHFSIYAYLIINEFKLAKDIQKIAIYRNYFALLCSTCMYICIYVVDTNIYFSSTFTTDVRFTIAASLYVLRIGWRYPLRSYPRKFFYILIYYYVNAGSIDIEDIIREIKWNPYGCRKREGGGGGQPGNEFARGNISYNRKHKRWTNWGVARDEIANFRKYNTSVITFELAFHRFDIELN